MKTTLSIFILSFLAIQGSALAAQTVTCKNAIAGQPQAITISEERGTLEAKVYSDFNKRKVAKKVSVKEERVADARFKASYEAKDFALLVPKSLQGTGSFKAKISGKPWSFPVRCF